MIASELFAGNCNTELKSSETLQLPHSSPKHAIPCESGESCLFRSTNVVNRKLTDNTVGNTGDTVMPRHARQAFRWSQEFPQAQKNQQHPRPRFGQDRSARPKNKYTCPRVDLKYAFGCEQYVSLQAISVGGQRVLYEWEPFSPCELVFAPHRCSVAICCNSCRPLALYFPRMPVIVWTMRWIVSIQLPIPVHSGSPKSNQLLQHRVLCQGVV